MNVVFTVCSAAPVWQKKPNHGCFNVINYTPLILSHNLFKIGAIFILCTIRLFQKNMLTCCSRKSTGVNNKMNDGWIPFSCFCFRVLVLFMRLTVMAYWDTWIEQSHHSCFCDIYDFPTESKCLLWNRLQVHINDNDLNVLHAWKHQTLNVRLKNTLLICQVGETPSCLHACLTGHTTPQHFQQGKAHDTTWRDSSMHSAHHSKQEMSTY